MLRSGHMLDRFDSVTVAYFVGPEDTINTEAPTAFRNARRDDVLLP